MTLLRAALAEVTVEAEGPGWQVVAELTPSGEILLRRAETGVDCAGERVIAFLELVYPQDRRATRDAMADRIADSLGFAPCRLSDRKPPAPRRRS